MPPFSGMDTITYVVSVGLGRPLSFYRLDENGAPAPVPAASLPSRLKLCGQSLHAWANGSPPPIQGLAVNLLQDFPKAVPISVWEDAGRPEGRAEEFWARAAELEMAARTGLMIQQTEIGEANGAEDNPPPRAAKAAAKRRISSSAEGTTKMPTARPAPLDTSSRQRAEPADGAAPSSGRGRQPIAVRRQSRRKSPGATDDTSRISSTLDEVVCGRHRGETRQRQTADNAKVQTAQG